MDKEQKLHIADTLNTQRAELNHMRQNLLKVMCKLDDLEMYVRMLQVEETNN